MIVRCREVALLPAVWLLALCAEAAAESVYKCRNPQGRLVYQESPCKTEEETITSWDTIVYPVQQTEEAGELSGGTYIIKQRDDGHYFLDGSVNGRPLTFVVDTGASAVSLPRSLAYLANMSCREQVKMHTANGTTSACFGVISSLKFGPFMLKEVPAIIAPTLGQPLLGMNVLQQFRVEQENGEMRISIKNQPAGKN